MIGMRIVLIPIVNSLDWKKSQVFPFESSVFELADISSPPAIASLCLGRFGKEARQSYSHSLFCFEKRMIDPVQKHAGVKFSAIYHHNRGNSQRGINPHLCVEPSPATFLEIVKDTVRFADMPAWRHRDQLATLVCLLGLEKKFRLWVQQNRTRPEAGPAGNG